MNLNFSLWVFPLYESRFANQFEKHLLQRKASESFWTLCEKLKRDDLIDEYHFEITTPAGPVTEKCLLSDQKVIA